MEWMIMVGAAITLVGVAGLIWCVVLAMSAKKTGGTDAEIKARLQRVVVINLGALAISAIGLMAVVTGVILS